LRTFLLGLVAAIVLAVTGTAAHADDWTVTRLRGTVQQLVGGEWQPLERGSVIPDERSIFTRSNGYATLVRGNEAIELGPNTKIEIYDQGGRKPFTTILQHAGTLTVEAEVRNVKHFAVKTAYLAAVVKGTRFTVTAKSSGGSVEVFRGQVSVEDKRTAETVLILPGQKASVAKSGGAMKVSGKPKAGAKPPGKATSTGAKNATGASNSNGAANGNDTTGKGSDKSGKPEDKTTKDNDKSSNDVVETVTNVVDPTADTVTQVIDTTTDPVVDVVDKTTETVDKVVDKTADTVDKVVDKTTDTVDKVVDTATDTVDKVINTPDVSTSVDAVTDNTTNGLTGLLGKKPR
jgi:hypothetical protein